MVQGLDPYGFIDLGLQIVDDAGDSESLANNER
jgi:hypothetical protein